MDTYCEWCGDLEADEHDHEVIVNLHMHMRTPAELVDDALTEAQILVKGHDRADSMLHQISEDWATFTAEEREDLDFTTEIMDGIESAVSEVPGLLALSDGGNTGDWLVVTVTEDD